MSDGEQLGLFSAAPTGRPGGGPGEPERQRPVIRGTLAERPHWSGYTGPHVACTECVRLRHEGLGSPDGPLPAARYTRTHRGVTSRLCTGCATHLRTADGFTTALPTRNTR
jgi:hypothetical protein